MKQYKRRQAATTFNDGGETCGSIRRYPFCAELRLDLEYIEFEVWIEFNFGDFDDSVDGSLKPR